MTTTTTAPVIPVYSWMLTGKTESLGFVESRWLLAGHMLANHLYGPGKFGPEQEWRRVQTYIYPSPESAREHAIDLTGRDECLGYAMFGPMVVADVEVDHELWAYVAGGDVQGTGEALSYVKGILREVHSSGRVMVE